MMNLGFASVAAICVLCYLVGEITKLTPLDNKWIPVIAGAAGGLLGVAGLFFMPEFPASDLLNAAAVGIVSGLSATGADQAVRQLSRKDEDDE